MSNRFEKCTTMSEVIGVAIGAGSMCWVGGTGDLEFDSREAAKVADEATERIREIATELAVEAWKRPAFPLGKDGGR